MFAGAVLLFFRTYLGSLSVPLMLRLVSDLAVVSDG